MEQRILSRIIAGILYIPLNGTVYSLRSLTPAQKYRAEEIYYESLEKARKFSYTQESLMEALIKNKIWFSDYDKQLKQLSDDVVEFKTKMPQLIIRSEELKVAKKALKAAQDEIIRLEMIKAPYFHLTDIGIASVMKSRYMTFAGLFNKKKRVFSGSFFKTPTVLIDTLIAEQYKYQIDQSTFRKIANSDAWRGMWHGKDSIYGVFGKPTIELNNDQIHLINWSIFYDNVYSHPERPSKIVIEDDDMLDGWAILQRRKNEADLISENDIISNPYIRQSEEVYVPVNTGKDAQLIDSMNNPNAAGIKRQRLKTVAQKGSVDETKLIDRQMDIRQEAYKQARR